MTRSSPFGMLLVPSRPVMKGHMDTQAKARHQSEDCVQAHGIRGVASHTHH